MTQISRTIASVLAPAILGWILLPHPSGAQPSPVDDAFYLLDEGWAALRYGHRVEQAGDLRGALRAYDDARSLADESLDIWNYLGMPFERRPAAVYYLAGKAHLDIANTLISLRGDRQEIAYRLGRAEDAFASTLNLVNAAESGDRWRRMSSDVFFSMSIVFFLRGELAAVRGNLTRVLDLTPNHRGAIDGLDAIAYAQGRRGERRTRGGLNLPQRPEGGVSKSRAGEYLVEIGKLFAGRWATLAGMVIEDLSGSGRNR